MNTMPATPPFGQSATAKHLCYLAFSSMLAGTGSVYAADQSKVWVKYVQPRSSLEVSSDQSAAVDVDVRRPEQRIQKIRAVLGLPMSDLVSTFGVSRQGIYKWIDGARPEDDKLKKLMALTKVADEIETAGLLQGGHLVKARLFEGQSLLDFIRLERDFSAELAMLIKEAQRQQDVVAQAASRSKHYAARDDWSSDISYPSRSEGV